MVNPIQVDKDIYWACRSLNEKNWENDFRLGGTLGALNKLYKNVSGFEHTTFDFQGKKRVVQSNQIFNLMKIWFATVTNNL